MKKEKVLITLLGRNQQQIEKDAEALLGPFGEKVVICRDGDRMKEDFPESVEVSDFLGQEDPFGGREVVLVGNGGTTSQLIPLVIEIVRQGVGKIVELPRDGGVKEYWG